MQYKEHAGIFACDEYQALGKPLQWLGVARSIAAKPWCWHLD